MKHILALLLLAALAFAPGCANQTTSQKIATAQQILGVALDGYAATNGGKTITPAAVATVANQLFGIAAAAQGNVGQTPSAANVAQGSAIPDIGSNVQSVLANAPISQAQVQAIFDAAIKAAAQAKQ